MTDPNRLPRSVLPRRYDLGITPDLDTCTFAGTVLIEVEVVEPTATIVLNAHHLDVAVNGVNQSTERAAKVEIDSELERLVITCEPPLAAGMATIDLRFAGEINSSLYGFYRSTYRDADGREHVLGTTQFEAPHARRAFPCFDEPDFKAVFAIELSVADGLIALSNGHEVSRKSRDGVTRVRFAETIPMSTYLVAWVVGPLELTEPLDAGGVAVRVAHVPGKGHLTNFAREAGAFAIRFFSDYYGIAYPGEKCDLVALPDFSFGAMENLGCVTFRESRLLLDPADASFDEIAGAALTIMHEVADMWFGDLVTMKWWNGIWLNEAFATFMEHVGIDAYKPEWRTWDDFAFGRAAALDVDALSATRTVEYRVETPADANGMFDVLTYQKGGSVLRMLSSWLGDDAFRSGVRHYLDRYQLANTETTDLWDAIEDATGQPVRQIMDSWIFQEGFPVLRPKTNANGVVVAQRRFTYGPGVGDNGDSSTRWAIPVLARVHANGAAETRTALLTADQVSLDAPADALVVLNAGGDGFYRVAYPAEWRDRLLTAGVLDVRERFSLVDDLWAAVLAGEARADELLTCAHRLADESEFIVWRVLCAHLRAAARLVEGDALAALTEQVGRLIAPTLARLGWDADASAEDSRDRRLRGVLLNVQGAFAQDPETIARAREVDERGGADADVAAACVAIVANAGGADDFERFCSLAKVESAPQAQIRYLYALAEFPSEELVLRAARFAMSDDVRPQNGPFVLQRALRNREHGPAAWAFVRDHWDEIRARFNPTLIARIIEGATWLGDDVTANDITTFLAVHPVPEGTRVIAQHVERLQVHRAAVARERERLSKFLLSAPS